MKKKLAIVGLLGFTFLFGCNTDNGDVQADLPDGYVMVSESDVHGDDVIEIRHIASGCHYTIVNGFEAVSVTQMYGNDGLPYCKGE